MDSTTQEEDAVVAGSTRTGNRSRGRAGPAWKRCYRQNSLRRQRRGHRSRSIWPSGDGAPTSLDESTGSTGPAPCATTPARRQGCRGQPAACADSPRVGKPDPIDAETAGACPGREAERSRTDRRDRRVDPAAVCRAAERGESCSAELVQVGDPIITAGRSSATSLPPRRRPRRRPSARGSASQPGASFLVASREVRRSLDPLTGSRHSIR